MDLMTLALVQKMGGGSGGGDLPSGGNDGDVLTKTEDGIVWKEVPPAEDQEAREMIQELESGKQDKLIQGSGINIAADGTISVSFADGLKEAY